MKKVLKTSLLIAGLAIMSISSAYAQCQGCPPPPPPSHGSNGGGAEVPPGGCAPVDGGLSIMLILGAAYAGRKTYQWQQNK